MLANMLCDWVGRQAYSKPYVLRVFFVMHSSVHLISYGIYSSLFIALLVFAVANKPSTYQKLFFPLLAAFYGTGIVFLPSHFKTKYVLAFASTLNIFQASDLILLNEPQRSMRRKGQEHIDISRMSFWERMKWAYNLVINTRRSKWTNEVPHMRRSSLSRWRFVIFQLKHLFLLYALSDILAFLVWKNPAYTRNEKLSAHGFAWQIWNVGVYWARVAIGLKLFHAAGSVVFVSAGWSDPTDWPLWYGRISETTSIRKFWGRTWHQTIRQTAVVHGNFIANVLVGKNKASKHPILYTNTKLFASFFISGVIHAGTDYILVQDVRRLIAPISFFVLQAVGIAIEETVITMSRRHGIAHRVTGVMGYVWVVVWMTWSSPILLEPLLVSPPGDLSLWRTPYPFFTVTVGVWEKVGYNSIVMFSMS